MPKFVSPSGRVYTQRKALGTGTFGNIIVCTHKDDSTREKECIVKRVRLARQTPQERFASVQELAMMQQLRHSNLIRGLDGWVENKHTTCLVMESCSGGDLAALLEGRQGTKLDEQDIQMMVVQLAAAVSYLHSVNVLHRDIKSSNIFLGDRQQLKLGDLGLCRQLSDPEERPKTSAGTLNYMSPELTNEESYSKPADIWALGCVLFEVCALKPAFYSFNCDGITKKIKSGKVPAIPAAYSEPLRQLVRSMLYTDEAKRPTAEAILAMPFLQEAKAAVEEVFGEALGPHDAASWPAFELQAVPKEWRDLMARFHTDHQAHETKGSRQNSSGDHNSSSAAAAGKARKPRGGWRVPPDDAEPGTPASAASSSGAYLDNTAASAAAAAASGSVWVGRNGVARAATCSAAGVGGSWGGSATGALHSFTAGVGEALTRLQPSDGDELMQAAAASARAGSALGSAHIAQNELLKADSITSALLESAGSIQPPLSPSGRSAGSIAGGCSGFQNACSSSGMRVGSAGGAAAAARVGAPATTGSATSRSPAARAANSAAGAEYARTSERIRSMNRKLRSQGAPGALNSAARPARTPSARTSLRTNSAHKHPPADHRDKVAQVPTTRSSVRGPTRHTSL